MRSAATRRSRTIGSSPIDDAERSDESQRIAVAQAYIDALVSHDGASVPFAPGCTRVEQGVKNGFSGNHLRRSLTRGPQYRIINEVTPAVFSVHGDDVRARYDVLTRVSVAGRRAGAHVDETFVISGEGLIHHIRVKFHPFVRSTEMPKPPPGLNSPRTNQIIKWMSRAQAWCLPEDQRSTGRQVPSRRAGRAADDDRP